MTYPTPTGQAPTSTQLTGGGYSSNLPKGWQSLPTTDDSEQAAVQIVDNAYGPKIAGYFKQWYDKARAKDPGITPNQAVAVFISGYDIATATGKLASFLSGSSYQVTSGSGSSTVNLGGGSEGPGVAQAAASAAESLYASSPGGSSSACALHIPGFNFGPVGWQGWCIISKTNLRAFLGGGLLVVGGLTGVVATVLAIGFAFSETKAGKTAISAATMVGAPVTAPVRFIQARSRQRAATEESEQAAAVTAGKEEAARSRQARADERSEEAHAERIRVSRIRTPEPEAE